MYYAIDDNLLARLKFIASSDSNNADLVETLTAAESNPLITSLIWTKADVLAACRKLIQGGIAKNADGSWFKRNMAFSDPVREQLTQEIAGDPDEFSIVFRDEVDNEIELKLIEIVRDAVEDVLEQAGSDADSYDVLPGDYVINALMPRLTEVAVAGGLNSCAREIAERVMRGVVG